MREANTISKWKAHGICEVNGFGLSGSFSMMEVLKVLD